ncbi:MAG TPA: hypothetical protein VGO57_18480, partial [Verrucomicrobiae bacterium]
MVLLESGLPQDIADDEQIARFLFNEGEYNKSFVKFKAFSPQPKTNETSVSRHGKDPEAELKELGEEVAKKRKQKLRGAAIFLAKFVRETQLQIIQAE